MYAKASRPIVILATSMLTLSRLANVLLEWLSGEVSEGSKRCVAQERGLSRSDITLPCKGLSCVGSLMTETSWSRVELQYAD